jgi:hypothetical protein
MLNQLGIRRAVMAAAIGFGLMLSTTEATLAVMAVVKATGEASADDKQVAHDKALKAAQVAITQQCSRGMIVRSAEKWKYTQATDPDAPQWKAHVDVNATCDDPNGDM